ncbi:MAG: RHS repeat domain-containing protein, partial [Acidimicrobiales bacterium]
AGRLAGIASPGGSCSPPASGCAAISRDTAGRVTALDYADAATPDVSSVLYDTAGRRRSMTDGSGTSTWSWDSLGRLVASVDGSGASMAYDYDDAGRARTITYPGGLNLDLVTGPDATMASMTDWAGRTTRFDYDGDANLSAIHYPNGTHQTYAYDRAGRPETIRLNNQVLASLLGPLAGPSLGVYANHSLTHDGDSRLDVVGASTGPATLGQAGSDFDYDDSGRLAAASGSTYGYDRSNNLVSMASTALAYGPAGQLCWSAPAPASASCASPPADATTYTHDPLGRRSSATVANQGTTTYTFDGADHLRSVNGPGVAVAYTYDGDGRRVTKTTAAQRSTFVWDHAGSLMAESAPAGTTRYLYGPSSSPLARIDASGTPTYIHTGAGGHVSMLTGPTGAVTSSYTYSPHGIRRVSASAATSVPFGYLGSYHDTETGLIAMGSRYLDATTASFLSRDPIEAGSCTPYDYACGDPINGVDLDGSFCWSCAARDAGNIAVAFVTVAGGIAAAGACAASVVCGIAAAAAIGAAAGAASYTISTAGTASFSAGGLASATAIGAAAGAIGASAGAAASRVAPRAIDDIGLSGRGLVPAAGTRVRPTGIPDEWRIVPTRSGGGVRYYDPTNPGNSVRVMQGSPSSPFSNSQAPYVRWQRNGHPIDVNGNILPTANSPDAHIPLGDFRFLPELVG